MNTISGLDRDAFYRALRSFQVGANDNTDSSLEIETRATVRSIVQRLNADSLVDFVNQHASSDPVGTIVKDAAAGAASGVVAAEAAGLGATALAVAIGADVATAGTVAVAAGGSIATGAGAGTAAGSTLGPIGAVVGAVVGVIIGIAAIFSGSPERDFYCDPAHGNSLASVAQGYFKQAPMNPVLAVAVSHLDGFDADIVIALTRLNFASFENDLRQIFLLSNDNLRFTDVNITTDVGKAIKAFFQELHDKGVSRGVASNVAGLFADFCARMRGAEDAWNRNTTQFFGSPLTGPQIPTTKDYNVIDRCARWNIAANRASNAFIGKRILDDTEKARSADEVIEFAEKTRNMTMQPGRWPDVSHSKYYRDVHSAFEKLLDTIYPKTVFGKVIDVAKRHKYLTAGAVGVGVLAALKRFL